MNAFEAYHILCRNLFGFHEIAMCLEDSEKYYFKIVVGKDPDGRCFTTKFYYTISKKNGEFGMAQKPSNKCTSVSFENLVKEYF